MPEEQLSPQPQEESAPQVMPLKHAGAEAPVLPPAMPEKGDIAELRRYISLLIQSNERLHEMNRRQMFSMSLRMSLLRGIMLGFGWVLGTTVVVTVAIYFMRPFLSVPYIGEMARQLLEYIEHGR